METLEWILILMSISITGCCVGTIVLELLKNKKRIDYEFTDGTPFGIKEE